MPGAGLQSCTTKRASPRVEPSAANVALTNVATSFSYIGCSICSVAAGQTANNRVHKQDIAKSIYLVHCYYFSYYYFLLFLYLLSAELER